MHTAVATAVVAGGSDPAVLQVVELETMVPVSDARQQVLKTDFYTQNKMRSHFIQKTGQKN
eukprot:SAG11_NODE_13516_length_651_cov_1.454710_1_plen_60_part_01